MNNSVDFDKKFCVNIKCIRCPACVRAWLLGNIIMKDGERVSHNWETFEIPLEHGLTLK